MSKSVKKLLLHLPGLLLPIDTGAKRKFLGTLRYLRERSDIFEVDIVARNDYRQNIWTLEQQQEALKTAKNFFLYHGEKDLLDFIYSRSKSFYYQKLLKTQMPVDTDYFSPPGYVRFVRDLISEHKYDIVWIQNTENAHLCLKSTQPPAPPVYKVLDIIDLLSQMRLARVNIPPLIGLEFDYEANLKKEIQLLLEYDKLIITSKEEMEIIKPYIPAEKLHLIPYPLDDATSPELLTPYAERAFKYDLLYVGASYHPNVEGMNFFLSSIFPKVIEKNPHIRLAVAGKVCDFIQIDPAFQSNVDCLGFVDDLSQLYLTSRVVICPLLHGSGTKIKLQEAMTYGIPIVTTTTGASGLSFKNEVNAYITDDPEVYAYRILDLLEKPQLSQKISQELTRTFEAEYSSSAIYEKLDLMLGLLPATTRS
jgi:glycosyltransferase involved in cell wall biosynthesis